MPTPQSNQSGKAFHSQHLRLFRESARWLVLATSLGVIVYSISVLWVVASSGDIGIRCVLGTKVKDVEEGPYRWMDEASAWKAGAVAEVGKAEAWSDGPPRIGDTIRRIGDQEVALYTD